MSTASEPGSVASTHDEHRPSDAHKGMYQFTTTSRWCHLPPPGYMTTLLTYPLWHSTCERAIPAADCLAGSVRASGAALHAPVVHLLHQRHLPLRPLVRSLTALAPHMHG